MTLNSLKVFLTSLFLTALIGLTAGTATAGTVAQCGIPEKPKLTTDPDFTYCNLHERRVAYAAEQADFRRMLDERRKNYIAPQIEAVNAYKTGQESTRADH